ncbi:MAG: pyridoxal phosphate-dependent aminotransferase, partial [Nitrospirales bacterium]
MSLSVNQRMATLGQSEIRAMTIACDRIKGINMAQGVCDTGVPPLVIRAAQRAMDQGLNSYTRFDGLADLREALAQKSQAYNGLTVDPETEVTVSAGATGAFQCACYALLNPGDEVLVFEPYYGYHLSALMAVEAVPRVVRLQPPDWAFDPAEVERAITPRTKALVINSPGNP